MYNRIQRNNVEEKLRVSMDKYRQCHNRDCELILIDVFSVQRLAIELKFGAIDILKNYEVWNYCGAQIIPIETSDEFILCQRKRVSDVFDDALYHYKREEEKMYEYLKKNFEY